MIIRNISGGKMYFGWIGRLGKWIENGETVELSDEYISHPQIKDKVTSGAIAIVSYDATAFSLVTQSELTNVAEALFDSELPTSNEAGQASSAGALAIVARRDHIHETAVAAPENIGIENLEGIETTLSRSDHVHTIDLEDGPKFKSGKEIIGDATDTIAVVFTTEFLTVCDNIQVTLENTTDVAPLFLIPLVTVVAKTGFTVTLDAVTNSANYRLNWTAIGK